MIQQDQVGAPGVENFRDPDWLRNNLENEEGVLQFLDDPNNQLEDQPTEVLIELAQKLKERRTKHYDEMLRVQAEQDIKTAEEEEKSRILMDNKEKELKDEMQKAIDKQAAAEETNQALMESSRDKHADTAKNCVNL